MPAQVLAAVAAQSQSPAIAGKPRVRQSGLSESDGPLAGVERVEIAFDFRRVDKAVPGGPADGVQTVRMRDQGATGDALVSLGAISSYALYCTKTEEHA
jgi:hypothetical protein